MDVKDQTTPPSGHGVHLCHRCGWAFRNPHPSAKQRRAHKKICGTIHGYTTSLILSQVGSDDDKEKTQSPKIEEKMSTRGSFSRSEDELFSDAVTEFSDSGTSTGSANKTLDKDLFFSFKDDCTNELLKAPIEISTVDTGFEVSEKLDTHVEKFGETEITTVCDSSELNLELTETGSVKDGVVGPAPELNQETKSVGFVEAGEEKGQQSQTSETITKEADDSELTKIFPDVFAIIGGNHDNVKQGSFEKMELSIADGISEGINQEIKSDHEHVSEVANEDESVEQTNNEKFELDHETASEVVKESETDLIEGAAEEIKHEKCKSEHKHAPKGVKESASAQNVTSLIEKVVVLTEKKDLESHEVEQRSIRRFQEVVKQPDTVLTEKEDLGGPHLEKQLNKHTHEFVEKPDLVLTKIQDLGAPELKKCSKEHVEEPNLILTEKEDVGALKSEKCLKDEVVKQKVDNDSGVVVADVSIETITQQFSSDNSVVNDKNASNVVHAATVEEGKMNNQDSGVALSVDSSTRSSLEGNWGSVSVLSTASIDAGTLQATEKSKVNSVKSNAAASDVFEPQSFMTLMEPKSKDKKPEPSEVKDSQKQPNSQVSEGGRKRNEELIAKVTNWSTGKQTTPLKNLLSEAKLPGGAQPEPMVQKDEAMVNDGVSSPPKLIDDDKKGRKKVKGISSWVPFVCCSSVNVVN